MLYLAIFFIIICIIMLVIFLKVNILIELVKNGRDDHCVISVFSLGERLKYKYEIPFLAINEEGIKMSVVKERGKKEKDVGKSQSKVTFSKIIDQYKSFRDFVKKNRILISGIEKYVKERIALKDFDLKIVFGAGEAHYTAIIAGLLWAGTGSAISIISRFMNIEKQKIDIKYDFGNIKLLVNFRCIITFKIVHIIVVGLKLLSYYVRGKIKLKNKTLGGDICG